jgi:hypothetical protein
MSIPRSFHFFIHGRGVMMRRCKAVSVQFPFNPPDPFPLLFGRLRDDA